MVGGSAAGIEWRHDKSAEFDSVIGGWFRARFHESQKFACSGVLVFRNKKCFSLSPITIHSEMG